MACPGRKLYQQDPVPFRIEKGVLDINDQGVNSFLNRMNTGFLLEIWST